MESIKDFHKPLNAEQKHLLSSIKSKIEADSIDTVSFEIFEMLVVRPLFDRLDIAFFMENDFRDLYVGKRTFYDIRCEAEKAVKEKAAKKKKVVTMGDVYQKIEKLSKISPSSRDKLMARECELEEFFCFARNSGTDFYEHAKKCGKSIILTADTYLPRETVERILANCGYTDYEALYITGECCTPKFPDGELFSRIEREIQIDPHRTVHFGCSFEADAEAPIKQGWQSMLVTSCRDRLVKSGRLCCFIQHELFFEFATRKHLTLRCVLGLYAVYAFDYPTSKVPHSDFCGDKYLLGAITLGALGLFKDFVVHNDMEVTVLAALGKCSEAVDGSLDFEKLFRAVFRDNLEKYDCEGCDLPLIFIVNHGAVGDRMLLEKLLEPTAAAEWGSFISEPELAPVMASGQKRNFMQRVLDKMFPPNTPVRKILDKIMARMHI